MYHIFYLWFVIVCRSKESLYDDARLIGYFRSANPGPEFRSWIQDLNLSTERPEFRTQNPKVLNPEPKTQVLVVKLRQIFSFKNCSAELDEICH
jgi:hypothetical protein